MTVIQRVLQDGATRRTPIELFDSRESVAPPQDFRAASPRIRELQDAAPAPSSGSETQSISETGHNRLKDPNGYYPFDKSYFDAKKKWEEMIGGVLENTLSLGAEPLGPSLALRGQVCTQTAIAAVARRPPDWESAIVRKVNLDWTSAGPYFRLFGRQVIGE